MPYGKQIWKDGAADTPLSAARLTHMEDGISTAYDAAEQALDQVSGRLSEENLSSTFVRGAQGPIKVFDVRNFLSAGQALPDNKTGNFSALLQAAIDAAAGWVKGATSASFRPGGIPAAVYVPAGVYNIGTSVTPRSKVGVVGDGVDRTVFNLIGTAGFQRGPVWDSTPAGGWTDEHFLDDLTYEGFTIECAESTSEQDKPFWMQNLRRPLFDRVVVRNSRTTAFGVDFIIGARFTNCVAYRAGSRGTSTTTTLGPTYSGFGFGTGRFQNEGAELTNCIAEECIGAGFYLEQVPSRGAFLSPHGFQMVNCHSVANRYGVSAYGCPISATASWFMRNRAAGAIITGSGSVDAAKYGTFVNCAFEENGDATTTQPGLAGGHGVLFGYLDNDGWTISQCRFINNLGSGITWHDQSRPGVCGPTITGSTFVGNGAFGIYVTPGATRLRALTVATCKFLGNEGGGIGAPYGLTAPHIVDNDFINEAVGIAWSGGYPTTDPIVRGNTFTDCGTAQQNKPATVPAEANIVRQSIEAKVAALAGSAPLWFLDERSNTTRAGVVSPAVPLDQPMTFYSVFDQAPLAITMSTWDGSTPAFSRTSTAWQYRADNGGAPVTLSITAPANPAVLAATQNATDAALYVYEGTSATGAVSGYGAISVTAPDKRSRCAAFLAFTGVHDATKRNAIMAALKSEFILTGAESTLRATLEGIAGAPAVGYAEGDPANSGSASIDPGVHLGQPYSLYVLYGAMPVANAGATLRDASSTTLARLVRSSGNTSHQGSSIAGTTLAATTLTAAAGFPKAASMVVQQTSRVVHDSDGGTQSSTISGWPAPAAEVASVTRGTTVAVAALFLGAHSDATRDAILAAMVASYAG